MNPSDKNKSYDELISSTFGRNELTFDFDKWKQDHTDTVREYQSKTQKKTNGCHKDVAVWRKIMKSNYTKLTAAAIIIVAIIFGVHFFNIPPDGANIAWAEMLETMRQQEWIHAVIQYEIQDRSGICHLWASVNPLIMVLKEDGKEIYYSDFERKVFQRYNYEENAITINSMEGMTDHVLNFQSPIETVEMMFQDMQLEQNEITSSTEIRDGKDIEIITSKGPGKNSTIIKDIESGLIIYTRTNSTREGMLTFEFDYPKDGPADIFALEVPEDARIIDNRPTGDLKELTAILNKKCKEGFGDFQAIVLESKVENDGTLLPSKVRLIQGKDILKRYDNYLAFDTTGLETKQQTIYEDIKDSWPDLSIEAVLAIDNYPAISDQNLFDGRQSIRRCWVYGPYRVESRTNRFDTFDMSQGWLPAIVWRSPGLIIACPDSVNKVCEEPEMDKEHIGLVGLRVRTTVKKTKWKFKTIFQPQAGIRDFWFDPEKDYILVEEVAIYEDAKPAIYANYSRTVVLEFAKTDKGQLYPSLIRTYSGDNADDPEMQISQQNITIDTSPVFEPGTFTVETMLQDKQTQ